MTTTNSRTVLISGASSGIGRATSELLLQGGYHVIGIGRDFSKYKYPCKAFTPIEMDLGNIKALPGQLTDLAKQYPHVDAIINCAGQGRFGSLEEFGYTQISELMDLNFISHTFVCRAFVPQLKKKPHSNIIFIGSEAALEGTQKGSIYCASKFALRGFAQALRQECSGSGIHVSIINPGMVRTGFFDELDFEPGQDSCNFIEVADVANTTKMILSARSGTVIDEINLSPLKRVVSFKKTD
jgi:short-subunit dehydrogenase